MSSVSVFFCWSLWHSEESEDDDDSEVGLKEGAGVDVSVYGKGLAQLAGLTSIESCNYINRASPEKTSSLLYYPVSRFLFY